MATWSVYEYARLYRDKQTAISGNNLLLCEKQFDALKQLIGSDESDYLKLFHWF